MAPSFSLNGRFQSGDKGIGDGRLGSRVYLWVGCFKAAGMFLVNPLLTPEADM